MAKADIQPEMALEEQTGSKAGRILLFAVPILFTVVLVGVLLTLLNPGTRNSVLETANKIPVVGSMLPKPTYTPEEKVAMQKEQQKTSDEATIKQLKTQLEQKTSELNSTKQSQAKTQAEVESLKKQAADAKAAQEKAAAAATQDPQEKPKPSDQVRQLAATYGAMSASKAAPILETLTNEEIAMIVNAMGTDQQSSILQKMTPDKAAKISIMLKNATSPQQLEQAANTARAAANNADKASAQKTNSTTGALNQTQLAQTFGTMDASSAATLLAQMAKTNQAKVLTILKSVDDSARSSILSQMASTDSETAAALANKLIGS